MHLALFQEKLSGKKVRCRLCNHYCIIEDGERGICKVRINKDGQLYSLVYENLVARNIDPIEKKPFFHFLPGSTSFSISTSGCNFKCKFCQNFEISQVPSDYQPYGTGISAAEIVRLAKKYNCKSISYTYTEPTVFFEYAYECAILAKKAGLRNNFVTNGYMSNEALRKIAPYLDAANVDLKGDERFYNELCGAHVAPVLNNIKTMKELGIWVEITTLIIPGYNDGYDVFNWLMESLGKISFEIPWHLSRFFPTYKMSDHTPTSVEKIRELRRKARESGFCYVYTGNIVGDEGENTFCPRCGYTLIIREGYIIDENNIVNGACKKCGFKIAGVWE
ncbi:MAG TPA: AmmeMemoRadiSam system radical SAM enzyme [Candidatus Ratteibacteria bacterium]|jgi:pyruvate formate lyase activating enzyme|uniref:Cyclic pyranopterin monophosphate synthase n=1 Tax=candidate division TA06 bacterium ADurb.Bin131 TaxID=1852827 RepID=A0A1V6C4S0_UNCT6|nr:MAG: Cyclic pyranopterin monophosphate synthase [candidate division TA06 bacterium ADurb.Bin131]HOC03422.1 AmmeMemoRadiSam system radical SAM enzyme [bacterium]HRS05762.1 AmmeMemoRadiSam system radical SAM enzyme [Candidatus Ratteibacteria bacterium]HON04763.1 AmmeMemoRadiSam system radical SAM enzyme [bacterium]HQL64654.1 AmmeMemoRadiSam system radical SAM enzyme [bacterium]